MIDWLRRLVTGKPPVSDEEREQVMAYYVDTLGVTGLQDREAVRYNSALIQHMNHMDEPESIAVMFEASRRLSLCGKELIRRHAAMGSIPELAAGDYAAWTLVYYDYSAWADAQHDAFVALSEGRTPFGPRVQELFEQSEKQRKKAETAGQKLLTLVGVGASDAQRLAVAGEKAVATVEWEPEGDAA